VTAEPLIVVEDPPPPVHVSPKKRNWAEILAAVRAERGKWCRVAQMGSHHRVSTTMGWLKRSKVAAAGFDFCTRRIEQGRVYRIYARFVGKK
jgi:hypothetical protein